MIDNTLRSAKTQAIYQQAIANGMVSDIAKLKGSSIGGLKILQNAFPMDIVYNVNDMLVDKSGNFWEFWILLGKLIYEEQLPHDQLIMNMKHKQSQPHVAHVHLVSFKDRKDYTL